MEETIIYKTVVPFQKKHIIYKMIFFFTLFLLISVLAHYFPTWAQRRRGVRMGFPNFFNYFSIAIVIIIAYVKTKTQIILYTAERKLSVQYMSLFKTTTKELSIANVQASVILKPNGRGRVWQLLISRNGKKIFSEVASPSEFDKKMLEKIALDIQSISNNQK